MGSGSSRLGSHPSRPRLDRRRKRGFAPFFCGTSRSQAPLDSDDDEMENNLFRIAADPTWQQDSIIDNNLQSSAKEPLSLFSPENECSSSMGGNGASCISSSDVLMEGDSNKEFGSRSHATRDAGMCLSKSKELIPCQADVGYSTVNSNQENAEGVASASKGLQPLESTSGSGDSRLDIIADVDDSKNEESSQISTDGSCSSSMPGQELGQAYANGLSSVQSQTGEIPCISNSGTSSVSVVPDSPLISGLLRDELHREAALPSSSGFLQSTARPSELRNGSVLHVDVATLSSDVLPSSTVEVSSHEARQNSRRLFWDAFSRRSSRRNNDSPTIIFSTEDTENVGSHTRRIIDFSGNLFDDGIGDLGYRSSRGHSPYERRWHSRSEIWERLHGGLDERRGRTTFCASGLHPDGTCSCETVLISEESSSRASISRIVMLAEALFEVLDEIHRQPISLSFSMVSLPAPESVVNSFPLKSHKKTAIHESGDDVEQCYICLAEYEEGDKIRVLPCRHEYHMSCVDKWLKEIHGVCPLCRGDVCEGVAAGSVSNS
ncbi:hypothetical protein MRB53_009145 [Persea americana]|uniref:Uncharacterized protein n=1 Tax=Persea americana TaxID=3435 RepID=A0ACC2LNV0_PERAE|nr:hypothetical protein MRB53_009145 [Persea americana]